MTKNRQDNFSHDWTQKLESQLHWQLYWNQLDLAMNQIKLPLESTICEIGVGSGLTSGYLKRKGYNLTTIDIDPNKKPDIVADITDFEFPFADAYMAFEIFEHIPFEQALKVWKNLANKEIRYLLFSLPYAARTYFWFRMWSPYFEWKNLHIGRKRNRINAKHHFWELDYQKFSLKYVKENLFEAGYDLDVSYRYRNHHFFGAQLR